VEWASQFPSSTWIFRLKPNGITLTLHPDLNDNASNWNLWQLQPTAHDILSICAHTHGPEKQQLILREWPILPQR
jgi:hypothetical protein